MGRRALWVPWPLLAAGGWLIAHWLMHVLAPDSHEPGMVGHSFLALHLCAACVLTLALLLVLLLAGPVLALGSELRLRLAAGRAPRPSLALLPHLPLMWPAPHLDRPPILASGHGERAPPPAPAPT
jgi:hypothetical protein